VHVEKLDFSAVRTTAGDLNAGDLERLLIEEGPLHQIAWPIVDLARERPTMVFAATVAHARALARAMEAHAPGRVCVLDGTTDREVRRHAVEAFARGEYQYMVNCALFTEGFDLPALSCIALARPTKSRALYAQMVGRGTRIAPGKDDCLLLDFRGNAGRHALVSAVDALAGDTLPEPIRKRAQQLLDDDPQPRRRDPTLLQRRILELMTLYTLAARVPRRVWRQGRRLREWRTVSQPLRYREIAWLLGCSPSYCHKVFCAVAG
jgi:hypothetical protein